MRSERPSSSGPYRFRCPRTPAHQRLAQRFEIVPRNYGDDDVGVAGLMNLGELLSFGTWSLRLEPSQGVDDGHEHIAPHRHTGFSRPFVLLAGHELADLREHSALP